MFLGAKFFFVMLFSVASVDFALRHGHNLSYEIFKAPKFLRHFPGWAGSGMDRPFAHDGIPSKSALATSLTLGAQTPSLPVSCLYVTRRPTMPGSAARNLSRSLPNLSLNRNASSRISSAK